MSSKNFKVIHRNIYLAKKFPKHDEDTKCYCKRPRDGFGCQEHCINRQLYIECGSSCALNTLCSNKRFQKRQYSKLQISPANFKGFGLTADENIPEGTFIIEFVGEVIDKFQYATRRTEYLDLEHHFVMQLDSGIFIDATKKGNKSRFINHSCDPNAEAQKWIVNGKQRIGIFSLRPINRNEEITINYGDCDRTQKCFCGSPKCRGWIGVALKSETVKIKRQSLLN